MRWFPLPSATWALSVVRRTFTGGGKPIVTGRKPRTTMDVVRLYLGAELGGLNAKPGDPGDK
jgi:hypothetical protein